MNNQNKILLGMLGAFAAGTVLGILLAPEKGSDLRKRISQAAGDLTADLTNLMAKGRREASQLKEEGLEKADELRAEAESKLMEKIKASAS